MPWTSLWHESLPNWRDTHSDGLICCPTSLQFPPKHHYVYPSAERTCLLDHIYFINQTSSQFLGKQGLVLSHVLRQCGGISLARMMLWKALRIQFCSLPKSSSSRPGVFISVVSSAVSSKAEKGIHLQRDAVCFCSWGHLRFSGASILKFSPKSQYPIFARFPSWGFAGLRTQTF